MSLENLPEVLPLIKDSEAVSGEFPTRILSEQDEVDLRHGKRISLGQISPTNAPDVQDQIENSAIAGISASGALVAMLTSVGSQLKSTVVFPARSSTEARND